MVVRHWLISIGILFFVVLGDDGKAQEFDVIHFYKSPARITYGLNNRRTSFVGSSATIFGGYIGVQWGERLKNVITANSSIFWIEGSEELNPPESYHLNYVGLAEEFAFLQWKRWEVVSYLHGGFGTFHLRTEEMGVSTSETDWVLPLEAGGQLNYNLTPWLTLIAGCGYRWVLLEETHVLDGFYYKGSIGFDLRAFLQQRNERRSQKTE